LTYDKTGVSISKKPSYAVKGDNIYRFDLSGVLPGVYFVEIKDGVNTVRSSFIISK